MIALHAQGIGLPSTVTADGMPEHIARAQVARIEAQWSYALRTRSDRNRGAIDMGDIVLHLHDGTRRVLSLWRIQTVKTLAALQGAGYAVTKAASATPVLVRFRWAVVVAGCVMMVGGLWALWPQIRWAFGI